MPTQPEQILENNLVKQLTGLKYTYVHINNEEDMLANLKNQLEAFIKTTFSEKEFSPWCRVFNFSVINNINSGLLRNEILDASLRESRYDRPSPE